MNKYTLESCVYRNSESKKRITTYKWNNLHTLSSQLEYLLRDIDYHHRSYRMIVVADNKCNSYSWLR